VVGAGIIGLACARALAQNGREVVIIEAQESIGMETSSRHSEVIHAGIYYPVGTNKAKWCVAGKELLYEYCAQNHVPYNRIGKLIVATEDAELDTLQEIKAKAEANGVFDLQFLSADEVHALEPNVKAVGALLSPSTGIIDSHSYMLSLLGQAENNSAMLAVNSKLISGTVTKDGIALQVQTAEGEMELLSSCLINCAGLYASKVARAIKGVPQDQIPETYYRKGNYFTYAGKNPFARLIYPVPVPGGLGTHSTVDLAGQVRFGPDVEWIEEINYDVDSSRREQFAVAIKRYWPAIEAALLQPGYAGIRPTLADQQGGFRDFCVRLHELNVAGAKMIGLYGIESPGLTSSLAIANYVANELALNY